MLTKCCSDSRFRLGGLNKFTACLNNPARWERGGKEGEREGWGSPTNVGEEEPGVRGGCERKFKTKTRPYFVDVL